MFLPFFSFFSFLFYPLLARLERERETDTNQKGGRTHTERERGEGDDDGTLKVRFIAENSFTFLYTFAKSGGIRGGFRDGKEGCNCEIIYISGEEKKSKKKVRKKMFWDDRDDENGCYSIFFVSSSSPLCTLVDCLWLHRRSQDCLSLVKYWGSAGQKWSKNPFF